MRNTTKTNYFTLNSIYSLKSGLWLFLVFFSFLEINGQTYGNLQMGGGGFISGIVTCKTEKDLIYVRTDVGGAYRWDATINEWIPLLDWISSGQLGYLGVESLAIDPGNPNNLYILAGMSYFNNGNSAVLRSTDKGKTFSITNVTSLFKVHGNGMGRNTGEKLVVDPNLGSVLFCGSRSNGLFKSTNSGANWSRVTALNVTTTTTGNGISFVLFDPTTGTNGLATQTLIAGVSRTGENLYRSNDGGATFSAITGGPTTLMPNRAVLARDSTLFITYTNLSGPWDINSGQIWKYKLSTGAWTNITPSGFTCGFGGISIDPINPKRVIATTLNIYSPGDQIFLSTNGGQSWVNKIKTGYKFDPNGVTWAKNGMNIHWAGCIEFDPFNTKRAFVVSGNGLFRTNNIDSTTNVWKFDVKGIEETVPFDMISIPDGPTITAVGDVVGSVNNDPAVFGEGMTPGYGTYTSVAFAALKPNLVFRTGESSGASGMYYSTTTGRTWTSRVAKGIKGELAISADGSTVLHCPENSAVTYRSVNNGVTWINVNGLGFTCKPVADPVNSSIFYAYNSSTGRMMVSLDTGASFITSGTPGTGGSNHVITVPGYEGNLWVALYGGGLKRSIDHGASYTKITTVTSCDAVGIGKAALGATYPTIFIWGIVSGIEGLFFSTDEGKSWNRMNDDAHEYGGVVGHFVVGDVNVLGRVYMNTAGRGIIYVKTDYILSSTLLTIPVGTNSQITPWVLNGSNVNWTWTSSNASIAKVDSTGIVTGIALGSSIITARTADGKSVKISVTIANPVTSLSLSSVIDTIVINGTKQLTATVSPTDATSKTISWSSIDPSVATVSTAGLVRGIKTGSTIITAYTSDGRLQASCKITVVPVTAVNNVSLPDNIDIYPNPLNGKQLNINLGDFTGTTTIKVIDTNGQTLIEHVEYNKSFFQLDMDLRSGIYLVQLTNMQGPVVKKLVVEN